MKFAEPTSPISGERAAVAGLVSELRPRLVLEVGEESWLADLTTMGGEVRRLATLTEGLLEGLSRDGRNTEIVILHAGRRAEAVPQEIELLLDSTVLRQALLLIDHAGQPAVRRALEAIRFAAWPKVARVDLDWIPSRLPKAIEDEGRWPGLGLIAIDSDRLAYVSPPPFQSDYHPVAPLLWEARSDVLAQRIGSTGAVEGPDVAALRERLLERVTELARARIREVDLVERVHSLAEQAAAAEQARERAERVRAEVMSSASWKLTAPLRVAKRLARPAS